MSEPMTLMLNDKEWSLSEDFKDSIKQRAESEFAENEYVDCWWTENERGDPVMIVETQGYYVPWNKLEAVELEMEEVESPDGDGSDNPQGEELDNGNGVKSVPKDDVDMGTPTSPQDEDEEEEEEMPDNKFMVTHPEKAYVPQPDSDDPDTIPADPEELPEDPSLVVWLDDGDTQECWSAGKALAPQQLTLEWNVQVKADEAVEGATKLSVDDDGHAVEVPRTTNHDRFEELCEMNECEVVAKKTQKQETPSNDDSSPSGYSGREADEALDGKFGGDNFHI